MKCTCLHCRTADTTIYKSAVSFHAGNFTFLIAFTGLDHAEKAWNAMFSTAVVVTAATCRLLHLSLYLRRGAFSELSNFN